MTEQTNRSRALECSDTRGDERIRMDGIFYAILDLADAVRERAELKAKDAEILPGTMGVLFVTAVDVAGNESCVGGNYVFALPAIDPAAAAAISVNYEIVWKKP